MKKGDSEKGKKTLKLRSVNMCCMLLIFYDKSSKCSMSNHFSFQNAFSLNL